METHWHRPLPATLARKDVPIVQRRKEYIQRICTTGDVHDVAKDDCALGDYRWARPVNHGWGGRGLRGRRGLYTGMRKVAGG